MTLNPIRRAFVRGLELGAERARQEDIDFLRTQAALHTDGSPSSKKRRGALNLAADKLRDGRAPGKTS